MKSFVLLSLFLTNFVPAQAQEECTQFLNAIFLYTDRLSIHFPSHEKMKRVFPAPEFKLFVEESRVLEELSDKTLSLKEVSIILAKALEDKYKDFENKTTSLEDVDMFLRFLERMLESFVSPFDLEEMIREFEVMVEPFRKPCLQNRDQFMKAVQEFRDKENSRK